MKEKCLFWWKCSPTEYTWICCCTCFLYFSWLCSCRVMLGVGGVQVAPVHQLPSTFSVPSASQGLQALGKGTRQWEWHILLHTRLNTICFWEIWLSWISVWVGWSHLIISLVWHGSCWTYAHTHAFIAAHVELSVCSCYSHANVSHSLVKDIRLYPTTHSDRSTSVGLGLCSWLLNMNCISWLGLLYNLAGATV